MIYILFAIVVILSIINYKLAKKNIKLLKELDRWIEWADDVTGGQIL